MAVVRHLGFVWSTFGPSARSRITLQNFVMIDAVACGDDDDDNKVKNLSFNCRAAFQSKAVVDV